MPKSLGLTNTKPTRGGQKPESHPGEVAANEFIVVAVGTGADVAKLGLIEGDRVAVQSLVAPIVVDKETLQLVYFSDVLARISGYQLEDNLKIS